MTGMREILSTTRRATVASHFILGALHRSARDRATSAGLTRPLP